MHDGLLGSAEALGEFVRAVFEDQAGGPGTLPAQAGHEMSMLVGKKAQRSETVDGGESPTGTPPVREDRACRFVEMTRGQRECRRIRERAVPAVDGTPIAPTAHLSRDAFPSQVGRFELVGYFGSV